MVKSLETVRVIAIPACRVVSSGCGMFGDGVLEAFDAWFGALPESLTPLDYLWFDEVRGGFVWYYIWNEGMDVPEAFEIVEFPGGLYAVATGIDGADNAEVTEAVSAFLAGHGRFERDGSRPEMGHIITPKAAQDALGYCQMDYWTPIRVKP